MKCNAGVSDSTWLCVGEREVLSIVLHTNIVQSERLLLQHNTHITQSSVMEEKQPNKIQDNLPENNDKSSDSDGGSVSPVEGNGGSTRVNGVPAPAAGTGGSAAERLSNKPGEPGSGPPGPSRSRQSQTRTERRRYEGEKTLH